MLLDTNNKLLFYLQNHREELLSEWAKAILVNQDDPFKEIIIENGWAFFGIVENTFQLTEVELLDYIEKLAKKVTEERVLANINIGDFVYNVDLGRTVIYSYMSKAGLDWSDLQKSINKINFCFDKFLYFAVTHYTEAKNQIIKEKNQFIDSTHQDRLTLLGQMTSSFIHEFRNPMTSIQGFIQLLKSDYPGMKYLDIISNELEQLNFRISQFLMLSRKELIGKEKIQFQLNTMIEEVLNFLYPSILDGKVRITKQLDLDIPLFGYADEFRQVLINIIFNAIDVLGQHRSENPIIEISSSPYKENHIVINITNNGPMIPEEYRKTIFEPFFTTKKLGTGLGLFVCKEIIEKHKGELSCISTADKTIFSIVLPIADASE
jgi:signal transduction histidine kinase